MVGLGEILRQTRRSRGVSLDEAERATHIARRFLEALEAEDFDVFSSPVFARGFLRNYSLYLGLDPAEVLAYWPQNSGPIAPPPVEEPPVETARDEFEYRARPLREVPRQRRGTARVRGEPPGPLTRQPQPRLEPTSSRTLLIAGTALAVVMAVLLFGVSRLERGSGTSGGVPVAAVPSGVPRAPGVPSNANSGAGRAPAPHAAGTMPNLVGQLQSAASQELQTRGITPLIVAVVNGPKGSVPGGVIAQQPAAGASISTGTTVTLTVVAGAAPVTVPAANPFPGASPRPGLLRTPTPLAR